MSDQNTKNQNQINIDLSEEIADGQYSNLSIITHSATEFVVDFVQLMPGVPKGKVKSRIILTPENAKKLMFAMKENIEKYESVNGKIKNPQPMGIPLNFGGPTTEA